MGEKLMCSTNNILLASSGAYRSVGLDPGGTVQLTWDELSVRLRPSEFLQVERLLEIGVVELELTMISDGHFCLEQPELGEYRLSLGSLELSLPLKDFLDLVSLFYTAARQLNHNFDQPVWRWAETTIFDSKTGPAPTRQQILH